MFDDPKKELERLQRELLASEREEKWEDENEDPEDALDEMKALLRRSDWEESGREPLYRSYTPDHEEDEPVSEPVREPQPSRQPDKPRQKGSAGMTFAIILEVAALLTFLAWWLLWR